MKQRWVIFFLYFFLCNAFLVYSNIPFFNRARQTNWGYDNPLIHDNPVGYFNHISFIREGRDGAWSVPPLYTTEGGTKTSNWIYFIFLGKISKLTGMSPFLVYTIARYLSTEILFVLLYGTSRRILSPGLSAISSILGILSVPLHKIWTIDVTILSTLPDLPKAWDYFSPFVRVDMDPHHSLGINLMIAVIILLDGWGKKKSLLRMICIPFMSFLSVMIHPTTGLMFCIGLPAAYILHGIVSVIKKQKIQTIPTVMHVLVCSFSALALLFIRQQTDIGFPWSEWMNFDVKLFNTYQTFNFEFMFTGGILGIVACISSLYLFFKKPTHIEIMIIVWAFLPYILLPFVPIMGFAKFRLALFGSFLPSSILTMILIRDCYQTIHARYVKIIISIILIGLFIVSSERLWIRYYDIVLNSNVLIPTQKTYIQAINGIKPYIRPYVHILASETVGMYIPAYIQAVSYIGNISFTAHYHIKDQFMRQFYSGKMTSFEARKFLSDGGIEFIFYGPNEWVFGDITQYQLPLRTIYMGSGVTVYEVKN